MDSLLMLIPIALLLGLVGLGTFLWALKSGQFEDLDGAANRILFEEDDMAPPPPAETDRAQPPEQGHKKG
ncbi:Type cbb3 cytochrome oxidase biogenesis protein CcoS, involved in heme b insertion [Caenispirillum salinarum AK4]|uniref:Type cbb3 cytochrome oxidase biogenesis protein CcoS, involved in heme b insertion n=1 Tax=Caenispirillum salinarum AK4 TaxID=1238182 RepID=K9HQ04_9PROT|nr:cbb3-type cytochrome oxidase assembly protein CcoS [Caenispirillum salinarum]EKV32373.1 Type cbb3 cytochrome oxidase biogenesis protein CcoS, involved in heme b insertion [Caenispirillum salinarum AK4]